MKKTLYIASFIVLALSIGSCQKEELLDLNNGYDESAEESRIATDAETTSTVLRTEEATLNGGDINPGKSGMVKEVSDGDDEADDGDDSKGE